jgi:hypothetical protein
MTTAEATDYDIARLRARRTNKWHKFPPDVLPAWVADMDFGVAPSITAALARLTRDQEYGYAARDGVLAAAFGRRSRSRRHRSANCRCGWWFMCAGLESEPPAYRLAKFRAPLSLLCCVEASLLLGSRSDLFCEPATRFCSGGSSSDSLLEGDGFELPVREHRAMAPSHGFAAASHREAALRGAPASHGETPVPRRSGVPRGPPP